MIYITGDTHIPIDVLKLSEEYFPAQATMKKSDYLIVCGDFGGVWDRSKEKEQILNELANRNFTTLFVDGNHENFDILDKMPVSQWHGGKVHFIRDSIVHLMRGQVFDIDGKTFFTMGGGNSTDKAYRVPHRSWWKQEMPSEAEFRTGMDNLALHNFRVDYVLTHTAPTDVVIQIRPVSSDELPLNEYLMEVKQRVSFKKWFFGHFHQNQTIDDRFVLLYDRFYCLDTQQLELFPRVPDVDSLEDTIQID
jgi:Icc-related predicted phosphoesterase